MAKKRQGRPSGGRPPSRRGKGGVGPGPGYRPGSSGGGTKHGGSPGSRQMFAVAVLVFGAPALAFLGAVGYVVAGHLG